MNVINASSVSYEYDYINKQRCVCGGELEIQTQGLSFAGKDMLYPFDTIEVKCCDCSKLESFHFDISSFYYLPDFNHTPSMEELEVSLTDRLLRPNPLSRDCRLGKENHGQEEIQNSP